MGKSEIKVSCNDQVLKITEAPVLATGGLNEVRIAFNFCEKWAGFIKTAIFYRNEEDVYYAVLDEVGTCVVPWEVCYEEGTFYFGVFGEKGSIRRTSSIVRYRVKKGAITSEMMPSDPTPEVYDQIIALMAEAIEQSKSFLAEAEEVIEAAKQAMSGALTATEVANESATNAQKATMTAITATENANKAANIANKAANNADIATASANEATTNANNAANDARVATAETNTARENLVQAVDDSLEAIQEAVQSGNDAPPIVYSDTGVVVTVNDSSDRLLRGLTLYGKTTQNGTPTPENPVALENVGASGAINTTVCGTNLISYPYVNTTRTQNGITFTDNGDGSVTANGTATAQATFVLWQGMIELSAPAYLSGCPDKSGNSAIYIKVNDIFAGSNYDYGYGKKFATGSIISELGIQIKSGTVCDNMVFYPQLEFGTARTAFTRGVSHQTLTTSTVCGLPGIPVSSGGNYTDENGQQWVCDEVDFTRGVYVQRTVLLENFVYRATNGNTDRYSYTYAAGLYGNANKAAICTVMGQGYYKFSFTADEVHYYVDPSGTCHVFVPSGFNNSENTIKVLAALAEPVETPLSAEELAQYSVLHTNKPNTTVFNDSGANLSVSYVADTKTVIENLTNAIIALGGNV